MPGSVDIIVSEKQKNFLPYLYGPDNPVEMTDINQIITEGERVERESERESKCIS